MKKRIQLPKKNLGGTLKDVGGVTGMLGSSIGASSDPTNTGASMSSKALQFGAAGMATGNPLIAGGAALVGGIIGAFQAKKAKEEAEEAKAKAQRAEQESYLESNGMFQHMRKGGLIKYKGNSHEEGGIVVDELGNPTKGFGTEGVAEVEGNETAHAGYVFSEKLKLPGSKKSFADTSKKIEKIREFRPNDKISNDFVEEQLDTLKGIQEGMKTKIKSTKKAEGGPITPIEAKPLPLAPIKLNIKPSTKGFAYNDYFVSSTPLSPGYINSIKGTNKLSTDQQVLDYLTNSVSDMKTPIRYRMDNGKFFMDTPDKTKKVGTSYKGLDFKKGGKLPKYDGLGEDPNYLPISKFNTVDNSFKLKLAGITPLGLNNSTISSPEGYSLKDNNSTQTVQDSNEQLYTGHVNALPATIAGAGNLALAGLNMAGVFDTKEDKVSTPKIMPRRISLAETRRRAAEDATSAKNISAIQSRGLSRPEATAFRLASNAGINKNLGNTINESYLNEELQNTQMASEADKINASIDASNNQSDAYSDAMNKAQTLQFLSKAIAAPIGYFDDLQKSQNYASLANMMNPNYQLMQEGKSKLFRSPKLRIKVR